MSVASMSSEHDLERFVAAQEAGGTYARAIAELRAGRKRSHWMWFVFPQIEGLGRTAMSRRYAIGTLDEAKAYLAHPLLGPRLIQCARAVCGVDASRSAQDILGPIDAQKLRSSMTLFMRAKPDETGFAAVIDRHFDGRPDRATDERLRSATPSQPLGALSGIDSPSRSSTSPQSVPCAHNTRSKSGP